MPAVGDLLADRFRIDGVLGAGGMATVYLATDLRLERQVAVKVLLPNLARDPSLAERFDREARTLASISHPNVAEVFDVERGDAAAGREPFYVMELCDGGSLAARIEAAGPIEPGALVPIIVSIAAALGELHRRGLIHRDVKPANILFTGGRPKLADFGLAKSGDHPGLETLTAPGTAVGTPGYMAPELVTGAEATVASDVYALAATTFHGLTGRAPRQTDSLTVLAASTDALPLVSGVSPRLGGAFDEVVGSGLADDPGARPSLNAFTTGLVAALAAPASPGVTPEPGRAMHGSEVDPLADTARIEVPTIPAAAARTVAARPPRPATRRSARRRTLPLGTAVFVLAFVGVGALALAGLAALLGGAAVASASAPPAGASLAPSPSLPAPTSSPAPTSTAIPSPTADPAAPAIEALGTVLTAIDAARGGHDGLKGSDANDLTERALSIGNQLRDGDYDGARQAATDLEDRVRKLKIEKKAREALLAAIDDLIAAIPT